MTSTDAKGFMLPHDPLTPLDPSEPPTALTVRLLCKELYANARSVESKLGGGDHGHLGMLMPEEIYIMHSNNGDRYVIPRKPRVPTYSNNAVIRDQQKEDYKEALEEYQETRKLQTQLHKMMIDAIPKVYLGALSNSTWGLSNVTPRGMLDFMMDHYGEITPQDLEENLKKIKTPWTADTPIETVFVNGKECRQFADEGEEPITDGAYIRILEKIFRDSGVLNKAVDDWQMMQGPKTIRRAVAHFTKANRVRLGNKEYLKDVLAANAATGSQTTAVTPSPEKSQARFKTNESLDGWF